MTVLAVIGIVLSAQSVNAQPKLWHHAAQVARSNTTAKVQVEEIIPSNPQRESIRKLLVQSDTARSCAVFDPEGEWLTNLRYERVSLSPKATVLLVEAGRGCARGGQGSNGAMWLVHFDGDIPTIIASPELGFEGFLFSVESRLSNGYREIILGWHLSAFETGLTYFRFDGKFYRLTSSATLQRDYEKGKTEVIPK